ncbi:putative sulfoacetate transporter SauU [Caulifigura coniformis]|uniref:Putative sulfoacetate transporter SauU n=1 Tax=Caulifigura coniformis TaxID=2527983 RepID=A0A517SMY3_9PLAN|nr:MFS transporter [Caulifigura coniformis]QDT57480.1 putative sulfoacetate transporter SauU [Caulifigura coniformis]
MSNELTVEQRMATPLPKRAWLVVGTFSLSLLLYVDRVCISAAEGPLSGELDLSREQMGWVMSAFALGYALFQAPSGWLADRYGPRLVLTLVVVFWSIFTGLTAAATGLISLLVVRFLFGAGEAGAFPGIARAVYAWIPMRERGLVQGINFSGGRLGAAFALPLMGLLIDALGWRGSFVLLMVIGFVWAIAWFAWFRNDPADHPGITTEELALIASDRQRAGRSDDAGATSLLPFSRSANLYLLSAQYFCSNFTFFFCLTWLFPHLKQTYQLTSTHAGFLAAAPFVAGAIGNWFAGWLVDSIYRRGKWEGSRRWPAIIGFVLAAVGVAGCAAAGSAISAVAWLSVAVFGADMTLAPSWSVCIDVGRRRAGLMSGVMNMTGNLGSFLTGIAFPYLQLWTGSDRTFFYVAAALNLLAVAAWMGIDPRKSVEANS